MCCAIDPHSCIVVFATIAFADVKRERSRNGSNVGSPVNYVALPTTGFSQGRCFHGRLR